MRILDENDQELTEEQADPEKGYTYGDQILKEHHEAIEFQPEEWHYVVTDVFFMDGTSEEGLEEGDPHVVDVDAENGVFGWQFLEGEEEKEVKGMSLAQKVDKEQVDAKEAWDEYEDILRYHAYTEEEIAQQKEWEEKAEIQQNFLSTGPDRLDTAEVDISALSVAITDVFLAM